MLVFKKDFLRQVILYGVLYSTSFWLLQLLKFSDFFRFLCSAGMSGIRQQVGLVNLTAGRTGQLDSS